MLEFLTLSLPLMADSVQAASTMRDYVRPIMQIFIGLAGLASVFYLIYGGFLYMTSRGQPDKLVGAKHVLKNALVGLVIVLGAAALTTLLSGALPSSTVPPAQSLPTLQPIEPTKMSSGLIEVTIRTVTGFLSEIITTVAAPFLAALSFFTESTPYMTQNPSVFNLWLVVAAMSNTLFVLVVALIGFQVMSASTFGLDEVEFKHLLPRIGLVFLLMNASLFIIDGFIRLSNVLIFALSQIGGSSLVWTTLTEVVKGSTGEGVAALLIMLVFLVFSVILLVYYVGRLVTLFIGAVLSPLVILLWLVPGFRDFSETAMKTYLTTIFVLFVHVVILLLASSLFSSMTTSGDATPNTLIATVTGLATVIALLKTQGVMAQFSYVSIGPRSMRQLGSQFIHGVSYLGGRSHVASSTAGGARRLAGVMSGGGARGVRPTGGVNKHMNRTTASGPSGATSGLQQSNQRHAPGGVSTGARVTIRRQKEGSVAAPGSIAASPRAIPDNTASTVSATIRKEDFKP